MAGRFPGAKNVAEFWQNLVDGVESIAHFTEAELECQHAETAALKNAPGYVRARSVLADVDQFDPAFFGITPKEAEVMDPQHRVFLECCWEALENAGYAPGKDERPVGVYAGLSWNTYLLFNLAASREFLNEVAGSYQVGGFPVLLGNEKDFLSTRVSYKLDLRGPSVALQCACSTSLVAVSHACQSLLGYQCDMALAGGVSISFPQRRGYLYQEGGMVSPDGHCRPFDARAQGTVFGHGAGVVVLKRLSDAVRDGDSIYAVIKGSAVNNDGAAKVGYTAPSVERQAEVIAMAQAVAGVDARTISYVEAHGTATPLGDPIEVAALTKAFRAGTDDRGFCAVGSVKSNVGHLDVASGVTGLIKTTLALKHQVLPPTLHFEQPNPQIDFANSPFYVNARLAAWEAAGHPRRAGVSSFGVGGTNAHCVLEEAPAGELSSPSRPSQLLLLSAKTATALEAMTRNLSAHLKAHPELNLADVAYTLRVGRREFGHRRMLVCRSADEACEALETMDAKHVQTAQPKLADPPVVFMFPGQGAQAVRMGQELYQTEALFRTEVDRCAAILRPHLGLDLRNALYPPDSQLEEARRRLAQTVITQPALFVVEYALARLWMSWGISPRAMIGHSVGEYVAACLAGVMTLEEALGLLAGRARLMQNMPAGAMLAVRLSEAEVRPHLSETLQPAAINSPGLCVVSGPTAEVEALQRRLGGQGVAARLLQTSHAFHSAMMEPILEPFIELARAVRLSPPRIPYISSLTGTWITEAEATDPAYWA
ncbi:MAG TPA: type I polyketide synthase, partial [Blastocatellia bacterium]|nr:type I polyketide synthase [Blastocatellia bacterium]